VDGGVKVGAGMLSHGDVVPGPGGSGVVEIAHRSQRESNGVGEWLRKIQDRGVTAQGSGEVDDVDDPG
jgi:hypothetical protein